MYALGCIPTPDNIEYDNVGNHLAMISPLPEYYTLIDTLPPVRDQGLKGSCVAHAVACMKESQEFKDVNYKDYFSPIFIYNNRSNKEQNGMYIRDALNIIQTQGILPEKRYPYDYDEDVKLSKRVVKIAKNYRIANFCRVQTMEELKYSLMESGACPVAFPIYSYHGKIWKSSGKLLGYHAMAIVGWNPEGFVLRNSWGIKWGAGGYTIYPYEDWGAHCEIWTSTDNKSIPERSKWFC